MTKKEDVSSRFLELKETHPKYFKGILSSTMALGRQRHNSNYSFVAGPMICLGKEFAYRQLKIFAAVLLGSFKFKLSDETKQVNYRSMLTLHVDGGLHIRATRRSGH
ncbi:Cytochrome P450 [Dillenia turbinata]|uniref:Cytochrome P450 n=1 Tax=Dillenia turbinata TaxID=194707 RepID=A0AAN8ZAE6_9MAGN